MEADRWARAAAREPDRRLNAMASKRAIAEPSRNGVAPAFGTRLDAYEWCARLARSHYENFTIASWLMPRAMRPHMYAIYAYARMADDFADEEHDLAKLDGWEQRARPRLRRHAAPSGVRGPGRYRRAASISRASRSPTCCAPFAPTSISRASRLSRTCSATARYSANPVGRLVLYLFGYRDSERQELSDRICSGLQLANFWQDIAIDLRQGANLSSAPATWRAFGYGARNSTRRIVNRNFVELMRHEVAFARELLSAGAALSGIVDPRLRRDILMFAGGGLAILRAIERVDYDVFRRRPQLSKFDYAEARMARVQRTARGLRVAPDAAMSAGGFATAGGGLRALR